MCYKRVLVTVLVAILAQANTGGFRRACPTIRLEGQSFLHRTCLFGQTYMDGLEMKDVVAETILDLGRCYSNVNGQLTPTRGTWSTITGRVDYELMPGGKVAVGSIGGYVKI